MTKILEHLRDPSWWFTALFVGIIASILASYLRSSLDRIVGSVSRKAKEAGERREAKELEIANDLLADPTALLLFMSNAGLWLVVTVLAYLMFFLLPAWWQAVFNLPLFAKTTIRDANWYIQIFWTLSFSLMALTGGYGFGRRAVILSTAHKVHRKQRQPGSP